MIQTKIVINLLYTLRVCKVKHQLLLAIPRTPLSNLTKNVRDNTSKK